jgi:hypothetical protein
VSVLNSKLIVVGNPYWFFPPDQYSIFKIYKKFSNIFPFQKQTIPMSSIEMATSNGAAYFKEAEADIV